MPLGISRHRWAMMKRIFAPMNGQRRPTMAVALHTEAADSAASEAALERLLVEGRVCSGEFPVMLANHLPMVLVAMQQLGGSPVRLAEFFSSYRETNRLVPSPPAVAPI